MAYTKQFEHLKIELEAIKTATNNFADENCIGKGGFGKVYIGKIVHSEGRTMVAFKRLDSMFGQGHLEFWKEIMMLSCYKHENIVSLLGYCDDSGEKILVYEYASKKSLDLYLQNDEITWVIRLKICIGAARGLSYLHTPVGTQQRLLHRDIKSSNILLDEYWNAKISDFGLSKFGPANQEFTYLLSQAVGTFGYCDPLYAETGLLTKESDVYSFGVVLFEVLCGRLCFSNINDKRRPLIGLVREYYENSKINELIYDSIKDEINLESLKLFTEIAYQCLKREPKERPSMKKIVDALESALFYQCSSDGVDGTQISGILKVKVIRGMNLKKKNTYVILKISNGHFSSVEKTTVKHQNVNPEWNEVFILYVERFDWQGLSIFLMNIESVEMQEHVGWDHFGLKRLTPGKTHTQTFNLEKCYPHKGIIGNIIIEMVYKPFPSYCNLKDIRPVPKASVWTPLGGGVLVVIIHEGGSFQGKHHTNPYVSLIFQGELRKTMSTKKSATGPIWEQALTFILEQPPNDEDELHFEVVSKPCDKGVGCASLPFKKKETEESLGYANISVANVVNKRRINEVCYFQNKNAWLHVELQWRTYL